MPRPSQPRTSVVCAICFLTALIEGYDLQSAGIAAPMIAADQRLDKEQLGWVFSGSTVGLFLGAILGGMLSDRFGRRTVLIGALLTFGTFSIASGFSDSFHELVFMSLLTGLGLGGALPNLIAMAAEAGAPAARAGRVTIITAGMPLGGAGAALLVQAGLGAGWREIFYVGGAMPIALAAVAAIVLPDLRHMARSTESPNSGPFDTLFGRDRAVRTLALWTSSFCTLLILYLLQNWLPLLLTAEGVSTRVTFWAAFGFAIGGAAGALVCGPLLSGRFRAIVLMLAYAGLGTSLAALAAIGGSAPVLTASACGFFVVGIQFALYGLSAECYPDAVRGTGTGAAVAAGRVGGIVGPLMAGFVLGAASGGVLLQALLPLVALAATAVLVVLAKLQTMPHDLATGMERP